MKVQTLFTFLFIFTSVFGFSDSVYNKLVEIAHYAKIAYCSVEPYFQDGPLGKACPDIDFCDATNQSSTQIAEVVRPNFLEQEISGDSYVAINDETKKVYAVFRGSLSPGDFVTDITAFQCPYAPILKNNLKYEEFANISNHDQLRSAILSKADNETVCEDCLVHCGVYVAFMKFIQDVYETADPYLQKGYELTVTGHSLGGGYALLGGVEFKLQGYEPLLITYASLRVGNPSFNKWVDEIFQTEANAKIVGEGGDLPIPSYSRVYQETDIVPRLPPNIPNVLEYTHSGLRFQITKVLLPQLKENVVFKGASNNDANDGIDINFQPGITFLLYQHLHEFTRISWPCNDLDV
ncbi:hypothetical protein WICANDRAFT_80970 [Wickerhamomyces anomalus NRRL Y-366-8]|uniref:triacylglycerol lipase n=1 Tax=Wickerhamomyces anomalus (strain ATCC 58044 / CBS 1984 / NCYC 433 / NRRL Y-366-8) TaxID=683960 RepID=A0A1E3NXD4_WICAA|nr:uncharacterized protein WICANDRAFT_80970 [Wickerhamomyces anomalus NRRL Y-366-8]ODQ57640.1 hypothetical protein WICANDRAFT_80970 [Wickerhamomyces anomalus NRRL Y-366-8]